MRPLSPRSVNGSFEQLFGLGRAKRRNPRGRPAAPAAGAQTPESLGPSWRLRREGAGLLFFRCGLFVARTRRHVVDRVRLALPGSRSLLEEAILDRLPYPFLDQSLGRVRYASAVGSELGQLVQVLPGCQGKCYRSPVGVGHAQSYHG